MLFCQCYSHLVENVKDVHTTLNIFKLRNNKKGQFDSPLPLNFYLHLSHYKNI